MSKDKYHAPAPNAATAPGSGADSSTDLSTSQQTAAAIATEPVVYTAQPAYWVLAALGLLASVMLIIDMFGGLRWDTVLFAAIGLVAGLWALWMASTRVVLLDEGLLVQRATAQYLVDWRQLLRVEPSGRLLSVMALIYHPRRDDGIIDTEAVGSLLVPGVRRQSELLESVALRLTR
ncbi:MAG: hypothetical protein ACRC1H_20660 [Caldilineaceae bacterium]